MSDRFTELLSDYLDHDLARAEEDSVRRHLETCADCREVLESLAGVKACAAALVDPPAPDDLWAGIASRIGTAGSTSGAGGPEAPGARVRATVSALPGGPRATQRRGGPWRPAV